MSRQPSGWTGPQPEVPDEHQERWHHQAHHAINGQLAKAALIVVAGAALTAGAAAWIVSQDNGNGLVVTVQLLGILVGPVLVLFAMGWIPLLLRRRWAVKHRSFVSSPARTTALGRGPFRLTVVQLTLPSGVPWVIFPETLGRGRVRKLVEREGQLLILMPRKGKLDSPLYAGPDGHPCFTDQPAMATATSWEQRGAKAIAERGLPAQPRL